MIAILISGHCRTFVYEEQRVFFEKFIKYLTKNHTKKQCDVYLMLKIDPMMQTEEGIINLKKMINMLKPVYSIAFKEWSQHDSNCYYSQMKMIRHLVDKAMNKSNKSYDYYIRIRPDCMIPNLEQIRLSPTMGLTTSRKFDSIGNDQFFIMTSKIVNEWFLKLPISPINISPDYYIFNHIHVNQSINSGLVRDYTKIQSWNFYKCHLHVRNYWIKKFESNYINDFINKLKNIINYQEAI